MSRSILVIDNEPTVREVLAAMLRTAGMEVRVATHGQEAIAQARTAQPDLVLLDVQLPGVSGWEVLECLRREFPGLPVVMMSDARYHARANREADGFIAKPYRRHDILAVVQSTLETADRGQ